MLTGAEIAARPWPVPTCMNAFGRGSRILTLIGLVAALVLVACGGSDDTTDSPSAEAATGTNETVAMSEIAGAGEVLVDGDGNALYTPDEESNGNIICTGACESEWIPLTVSGSSKPTAAADVSGQLATVKRPDGSEQVTLDGAPLYTFVDDGGPGQVTGDGFSDEFGGKQFTWHVVRPAGASAPAPETTTTEPSGGYSY
jgi:predicted lipoprotein with Yx(FWY)xxD motif